LATRELPDPNNCRRALRDIGEIAAVAMLEGSQLTEHEALQMIAAIAEWIDEDAPADPADCGHRIHRLHAMTASLDFDALSDPEAMRLFGAVLRTLEAGPGEASVDLARFLTDRRSMWGIELTDATGRRIEEVVICGPIETLRDRCRGLLDARPEAVLARLVPADGLLEYEYPERPPF